jgi:hypothetical protein
VAVVVSGLSGWACGLGPISNERRALHILEKADLFLGCLGRNGIVSLGWLGYNLVFVRG